MKKIAGKIPVLLHLFLLLIAACIKAGDNNKVGIDEKTGQTIPLDLHFLTSDGDTVLLRDLIDKPTLIAFVYYECPGLCSPMQSELAWTVDHIELEPGTDFRVISISFDHHETPVIAAKWKATYLKTIKRKFENDNWLFLTGDSVSIRELTEACGFYFKPADKQFIHAPTLIAISPHGKISRYLFGTEFNPFDVKMALLEANAGKSNPAITTALQFCYSYDPKGRLYTLNVTRIAGVISLLGVGIFLSVLLLKKKSNRKEKV